MASDEPEDELLRRSQAYLDRLFGEGAGARHTGLVDRFEDPTIRETLHRYHVLEADTEHLSVEENYLLGMCVLCAQRHYVPAQMFAKTLRHLGVPKAKILAAVGRLSMWIGGVPAADALGHIQRAVKEYDREGLDSMRAWFPEARSTDGEGPEGGGAR